MMTIPFQTIGSSRLGLLLPVLRQGLFYVPFILLLPRLWAWAAYTWPRPAQIC